MKATTRDCYTGFQFLFRCTNNVVHTLIENDPGLRLRHSSMLGDVIKKRHGFPLSRARLLHLQGPWLTFYSQKSTRTLCSTQTGPGAATWVDFNYECRNGWAAACKATHKIVQLFAYYHWNASTAAPRIMVRICYIPIFRRTRFSCSICSM